MELHFLQNQLISCIKLSCIAPHNPSEKNVGYKLLAIHNQVCVYRNNGHGLHCIGVVR